ncbi:hypothetical protein GQ55_2G124100 [Panicum hallii var. hallii]|uniref:Uncharacterized protein n=1 Tax=Panicum hallii var. hallii TaxID=1504633 RepID=A0A2T7EP59_9POAL|nr:hypothetical protein GQ55_2G124100 [Panicum hallii var. hallii]
MAPLVQPCPAEPPPLPPRVRLESTALGGFVCGEHCRPQLWCLLPPAADSGDAESRRRLRMQGQEGAPSDQPHHYRHLGWAKREQR